MKKIIFALLPCIFIILCISCYKNEVSSSDIKEANKDKQANSYASFRDYSPPSKIEYLALSISEKKEAWISKMEYILNTQVLNSTQESLIEQLIDNIEALEGANSNEALDATALLLLEQFSETDFIKTFGSLKANTLSGTNTPIDISLTVTGGAFGGAHTPIAGHCTCDWTCPDPYCATCTQTTSDCGFLNMYPCVGVGCADCNC